MSVKPYKRINTKYVSYYCGACHQKIPFEVAKCRFCGTEIEWEKPDDLEEIQKEPSKRIYRKQNKDPPKKGVYAIIFDNGKRKTRLESWRYYEILDTLRWLHVDRLDATDAAKWCMKAKPGMEFELILTDENRVMIKIEEGE